MFKLIEAVEAQGKLEVFCTIPVKELKDNSITELDVSKRNLGVDGAVVLSHYIKDNGELSSLNLLKNSIGVKQAQELVKIKIQLVNPVW